MMNMKLYHRRIKIKKRLNVNPGIETAMVIKKTIDRLFWLNIGHSIKENL